MFNTLLTVVYLLSAYLIGSICSAIVVCRMANLPDPRTEGSMNPGTTNVLRIAGKKYAVLVLLGDLIKGTIPVVIFKLLGASPMMIGFTCLAAVFGHMYPVFFGFKGGKGVATALGGLLGIQVFLGVLVVGTWLLVAKFSKYSSLAAIVALSLAPFYSLLVFHNAHYFLPLAIMTIFIVFKHRTNIVRLIDGTETTIKFSRGTKPEYEELNK